MSVTIRIILVLALLIALVIFRRGKRGPGGKGRFRLRTSIGPSNRSLEVEKVHDGPIVVGAAGASRAAGMPQPEMVVPGIERKLIAVGDHDIWYLEGGARTGDAVLLLHGFAGDKEQWLGLMSQLLGQGLRVVAPDLPGCGQNDKDPEASYDIMSQVKHIRAFAHRVGISSAHLVGASMGAVVAAAFAYGVRDVARSLVLIEPFCLRVPRRSELDELLEQGRNPLIIAAPAGYENLMSFLCARPVSDRFKRQRAERLAADRRVNLKIWQDVCEGERAHLLDLLLPALTLRTLVIVGAKSRVVHAASAEVIRGMMPAVQAVVLEDCGHLPMLENLTETAKHVVRFVLSVGQDPAPVAADS